MHNNTTLKFCVHHCLSDNLGPKINIHSLESQIEGGEGEKGRTKERKESNLICDPLKFFCCMFNLSNSSLR